MKLHKWNNVYNATKAVKPALDLHPMSAQVVMKRNRCVGENALNNVQMMEKYMIRIFVYLNIL